MSSLVNARKGLEAGYFNQKLFRNGNKAKENLCYVKAYQVQVRTV